MKSLHSPNIKLPREDFNNSRAFKKFSPFPFPYHEELTINITDVTNLGCGVGRQLLPDGSKWVLHVPYTIPGETVKCKVFQNHASYSEADLVEVLSASTDRVAPPCRYFMECGGCQYQHMTLEAQRHWKRLQVVQLLKRIGGFDAHIEETNSPRTETRPVSAVFVSNVVGSEHSTGYRAKLTPHYDIPRLLPPTADSPVLREELRIGFQAHGSRRIVDIEECAIATPAVNEEYSRLRAQVKKSLTASLALADSSSSSSSSANNNNKKKLKGATLLLRGWDQGVATDPRQPVTQTVCGVKFRFAAGEFFQNNLFALPLMVEHVLARARGDGCTRLIDTYCGSGLFALCAASSFAQVWGVEVSARAVQAAQESARLNSIGNAHFVSGVAEDIFVAVGAQLSPAERDETALLIDPPRAGCDQLFLQQLLQFRPRKVVYVSCDPATQARDARVIVGGSAGYRVVDVTPFDLFPHTRHIENVMVFMR